MPPLVIDGIPTPVEKMTQAQLRAFIPLMLKYSTGRGKPGWGKDTTKPPWWPEGVPWANVRMDARKTDDKQKVSNLIHKWNGMSKRSTTNRVLKKTNLPMHRFLTSILGVLDPRITSNSYKLL